MVAPPQATMLIFFCWCASAFDSECGECPTILCGIFLVPQNIVMNMNNIMESCGKTIIIYDW